MGVPRGRDRGARTRSDLTHQRAGSAADDGRIPPDLFERKSRLSARGQTPEMEATMLSVAYETTLEDVLLSDAAAVSVGRYRALKESLTQQLPLLTGPVLDFGCGSGLSLVALLELGVTDVVGVEPDAERVRQGKEMLVEAGHDPDRLIHVSDTRHLPFGGGHFRTVRAQAVFEHIPQPRGDYIREVWRVVRPGGHLVIPETPNKYFPRDVHTTGLMFVPWLPSLLAHWYARKRGAYWPTHTPWEYSGWRGLGHYELTSVLPGGSYEYLPELTRPRHRLFQRLGLPAGLLDPYPLWVLRRRS